MAFQNKLPLYGYLKKNVNQKFIKNKIKTIKNQFLRIESIIISKSHKKLHAKVK